MLFIYESRTLRTQHEQDSPSIPLTSAAFIINSLLAKRKPRIHKKDVSVDKQSHTALLRAHFSHDARIDDLSVHVRSDFMLLAMLRGIAS